MLKDLAQKLSLKPGSLRLAVLMGLASFFLLGGYAFIRSPVNTLFKAVFTKHALPYGMAALPLTILVMIYFYSKILAAFGPKKTLAITGFGSSIVILGSYGLYKAGFEYVIGFLFVFSASYIVLLVEQFWSFIITSLVAKDAQKVNGLIGGISALGAVSAGEVGAILTGSLGYHSTEMIAIAALFTIPGIAIALYTYRITGEKVYQDFLTSKEKSKVDHFGLDVFKNEKIMALLFLLTIATQVYSTLLSLSFQGILQDQIPNINEQTAYSYQFFSLINQVSAFLLFVGSPFLLTFVGPVRMQIATPFIHLGILGVAIYYQGDLFWTAACFLTFKSLDYSLYRTSKEILYMPLSFDARFRAKEMIDVFAYRIGKGGTSLAILGLRGLKFATSDFGFLVAATLPLLIWLKNIWSLKKLVK
jgi:AAA family ATP:ADP antiporter